MFSLNGCLLHCKSYHLFNYQNIYPAVNIIVASRWFILIKKLEVFGGMKKFHCRFLTMLLLLCIAQWPSAQYFSVQIIYFLTTTAKLLLTTNVLCKGTVSAEFRANRPKLCGNCAFEQNFHTMKVGEIWVFYAMYSITSI